MELSKLLPNSLEVDAPFGPFYLDFHSAPLSDEQFDELCRNHDELKFELLSAGWSAEAGGVVFDSSTLFTFPSGAKLSPDVSWMRAAKWDSRPESRFDGLVPDSVIELLAATDNAAYTNGKMEEYIENGVSLGWLIDPMNETVHIYRESGEVEILKNPEKFRARMFCQVLS